MCRAIKRLQSGRARAGRRSTEVGYEFDGIPINRGFDNYVGGGESSLGQLELQVYTGATPANAEAQGLAGFINQVIKTGTYPGYGSASLSARNADVLSRGQRRSGRLFAEPALQLLCWTRRIQPRLPVHRSVRRRIAFEHVRPSSRSMSEPGESGTEPAGIVLYQRLAERQRRPVRAGLYSGANAVWVLTARQRHRADDGCECSLWNSAQTRQPAR